MEFVPMIILAQNNSNIYPNTNLNVTLWFYNYDDKKKEKVIYMQNNYNKYTNFNDLVPISIDKENPIVLKDIKLNISNEDLERVKNFIKDNYDSLITCVNDEVIDYSMMEYTWVNKYKPIVIDGFFTEHLSPKDINIPVSLYFYCNNLNYDDSRSKYSLLMQNKYGKHLRFEDYITISIEKENPHILYNSKLGISKEDFNKVVKFIKDNYDVLVKYIDNADIDFDDTYRKLKV